MAKLGLVSISFRTHSPQQILEAMQSAGLQYIEWGSDVHAPPEKAAEVAALTQQYGITCCSYGTYFRLGVDPVAELISYLDAAKALGTNIVRLWCGNKNSEDYTESEKQALFTAVREAAALAQEHNIILCMECHNNTFTNRKNAALELLAAADSICMYWQPNQLRSEEENLSYAKAVCDVTRIIHVFNWSGKEKFPLHLAEAQWKKYLECFDSSIPYLLEFMPDDNINTLAQEARALRDIVQ